MNFGNLPTSKFSGNFKTADPGVYFAKIAKAEVKKSKNTGNEYLSVRFTLEDKDGKKCGSMFDMFFDSDKSFLMYKLRRFLEACEIPCTGEMSLKDLGVLVEGKSLVVWTTTDEFNEQTRVVPNLRDAEGYYPESEFQNTYNIWAQVNDKPVLDDGFINVPEGEDEELPFASGDDNNDDF